MTFRNKVEELLKNALEQNIDLFLISLKISSGNKIEVVIDGDNGVNLQNCIDISRAIEHALDREEEDFSLEVFSAGVSSPLQNIRQYKKNIGRTLKVKTENLSIEALLHRANDEYITLKWKSREPKKVGKGKEAVENTQNINYQDIKEAIVLISF